MNITLTFSNKGFYLFLSDKVTVKLTSKYFMQKWSINGAVLMGQYQAQFCSHSGCSALESYSIFKVLKTI